MRWRLKGVGRESQEQGSRNQHQGCLETKTTASARQAFLCVLPRQNAASGTVCPGLQVGAGWRGDEVRWPGYSYRQGKVLAFSLSLRRQSFPSPLSRSYAALKDESWMYCDNLLGLFRTVSNVKHSIPKGRGPALVPPLPSLMLPWSSEPHLWPRNSGTV